MSLSAYHNPAAKVVVSSRDGDLPLDVRGLSPQDIAFLLQTQSETVKHVYEKAVRGELIRNDGTVDMFDLISQFPLLMAMTIALACDEPEKFDVVLEMPVGDQAKLLQAILGLSMEVDLATRLGELLGQVLGIRNGERRDLP